MLLSSPFSRMNRYSMNNEALKADKHLLSAAPSIPNCGMMRNPPKSSADIEMINL